MKNSLFDLSDSVALVIGGTGALGGAMASALAKAGARVAVAGRSQERGQARCDEIIQDGGEAAFFSVDASSRQSLSVLREGVAKKFGPVKVLVNAAGGNHPKVTVTDENPVEKITAEDWNENFNLNLVGGILLPCQEFGPAMCEAKGGSIINIASVSAHLPLSRVVAYSAAKAAVLNLSNFLAREWAPHAVRVNTLTPGFFPAEQNRRLLFNEDGTPTERGNSILNHTPMGRLGRADELAGAAVFLASDAASSFITGTDIRIDGGFLSQTI